MSYKSAEVHGVWIYKNETLIFSLKSFYPSNLTKQELIKEKDKYIEKTSISNMHYCACVDEIYKIKNLEVSSDYIGYVLKYSGIHWTQPDEKLDTDSYDFIEEWVILNLEGLDQNNHRL